MRLLVMSKPPSIQSQILQVFWPRFNGSGSNGSGLVSAIPPTTMTWKLPSAPPLNPAAQIGPLPSSALNSS